MSWSDWLLVAGLALAIVAYLAAVWGILIERHLYAIRRETVAVLPAGSKPIRVLHIGDLHIAPWQFRKLRWLSRLDERIQPDLVVNTGDNLGNLKAEEPTLVALASLLKRPGVFVNGSNDYYAPVLRNPLGYLAKPSERSEGPLLDTAKLTSGFTDAGWLDLNNASGTLTINGSALGFIGVDDAHDDLDKTDALPAPSGFDLAIGVTHAPYRRVIDAFVERGIEVAFAGHTHGGQVCLPIVGALTTNCDLPNRYAKGLSAWGAQGREMLLNVVAGLGHSIYAPVRFFCRPEVRVLELVVRD